MEWSNGVIFLIATFCWEGLCRAELTLGQQQRLRIHQQQHVPNDPVGSFSNHILDVILVRDVERDLS